MQKTIKLTTLSPIHIGAGNELTPMEFVIYGNRCYIVNEDRLLDYLKDKGQGKIDNFIAEASSGRLNLSSYLKGANLFEPEKISSYSVSLSSIDTSKITRIRPFIRNAFGQPYIPGTAIKGAIRTAILFFLLKKIEGEKSESDYERFLGSLVKPGGKREEVGTSLVNELLKNFRLPEVDEKSAHTDILKALKVSDTKPLDKDSLQLKEIKMVRLNAEKTEGWDFTGGISICAECIPEGTSLEFDLKIDEDILGELVRHNKDIPFDSTSNILKMCRDFTIEAIDKGELSFFGSLTGLDSIKSFYNNKASNLRLGWGSGILETTVFGLLTEDLKKRVIGKYFPKSKYPKFPRTRRVVVEGSTPVSPLGWVRLE